MHASLAAIGRRSSNQLRQNLLMILVLRYMYYRSLDMLQPLDMQFFGLAVIFGFYLIT